MEIPMKIQYHLSFELVVKKLFFHDFYQGLGLDRKLDH